MVQELNFQFDLEKLRSYFQSIRHLGSGGQVSLTYREGKEPYKDGLGQLYSDNNEKLLDERDFSLVVDGNQNPIFDIISQVRAIAQNDFSCFLGRIRFMTSSPKTCLSYHRDLEKYRFHIPLFTNRSCFFVVNDRVYRMPKEGNLYTLQTDQFHTPVNAHKNFERTHLVFSTYT